MYLQEFTLFDFDVDFRIKVEVTLNVAQYSLHHATYALAKFEVAKRFKRGRVDVCTHGQTDVVSTLVRK